MTSQSLVKGCRFNIHSNRPSSIWHNYSSLAGYIHSKFLWQSKEKVSALRTDDRPLNFLVDDVPSLVKASPFSFNGETRFYVSVNDSPQHVFTWDSELKRLRAIDDNAGVLPESLEAAIVVSGYRNRNSFFDRW